MARTRLRRRPRFDRFPDGGGNLESGLLRNRQLPRQKMPVLPQLLLLQGAAGVGDRRYRRGESRALLHRSGDALRRRKRRRAAAELRRGADRRSAYPRKQRGRTSRAPSLARRSDRHVEPALQPGFGAGTADASGLPAGTARRGFGDARRGVRLFHSLRKLSRRAGGKRPRSD